MTTSPCVGWGACCCGCCCCVGASPTDEAVAPSTAASTAAAAGSEMACPVVADSLTVCPVVAVRSATSWPSVPCRFSRDSFDIPPFFQDHADCAVKARGGGVGDTFVRSCECVWWLWLPCSLYRDEPMRCIRRTSSPRKRGFFYVWALSFAQRIRYAEHALHKRHFSVIVYLSTPRGDGCPVGAAGLNNFRVTRLTHRSVFWLRRKRNQLEVE